MDLHLLACLDALLKERKVTRAAERMNMSQAGMSNALARLRQKLNDPLLVRTSKGMEPTDRALQMELSIRTGLMHLEAAFSNQVSFEPATSEAVFKIAISDYVSVLCLPDLMDTLLREAPNVKVVTGTSDSSRLSESLEDGSFHLCVGYYFDPPPGLHASELFTDQICCIARKGHPIFNGKVNLENYLNQPHVLMVGGTSNATFEAVTDSALQLLGLSRNIVMRVPNLMLIPWLVAGSDIIATVPRKLARLGNLQFQLQEMELPFEVPPYRLTMMWNELTQKNDSYKWLRSKLRMTTEKYRHKQPLNS
jgi:DNA-binding transcriptional LysR family regulator